MGFSHGERMYIKRGIEENVRNDGRGRLDYRYWDFKTGVIPSASGSCELTLDKTRVIVAIKAEIGEPEIDSPDKGKVVCAVRCTPIADDAFMGRDARDVNVQLSADLHRIIHLSNTIDLKGLGIIPGKSCWVINIDCSVLDHSGNLLDACALATKAALKTALVPSIEVVVGDEPGKLEIQVNDDPFESKALPVDDVPVCVSLAKVGSWFVVDPTLEEEDCVSASLQVAVNSKGDVCGTHKTGLGGIAPQALIQMIKQARSIGVQLNKQIDERNSFIDE